MWRRNFCPRSAPASGTSQVLYEAISLLLGQGILREFTQLTSVGHFEAGRTDTACYWDSRWKVWSPLFGFLGHWMCVCVCVVTLPLTL